MKNVNPETLKQAAALTLKISALEKKKAELLDKLSMAFELERLAPGIWEAWRAKGITKICPYWGYTDKGVKFYIPTPDGDRLTFARKDVAEFMMSETTKRNLGMMIARYNRDKIHEFLNGGF